MSRMRRVPPTPSSSAASTNQSHKPAGGWRPHSGTPAPHLLCSLHAAIRAMARPLPEDAIWRVLLQVALALHHMHARQGGGGGGGRWRGRVAGAGGSVHRNWVRRRHRARTKAACRMGMPRRTRSLPAACKLGCRRMLHRDVKSLNIFLSGPLDQPGRPPAVKLGDVGEARGGGTGWSTGAGLLLQRAAPWPHAAGLAPPHLRAPAVPCLIYARHLPTLRAGVSKVSHTGADLDMHMQAASLRAGGLGEAPSLRQVLLCQNAAAAADMAPAPPALPSPPALPAWPVLEDGRNHASTGLGTPYYLSPEICQAGAGWPGAGAGRHAGGREGGVEAGGRRETTSHGRPHPSRRLPLPRCRAFKAPYSTTHRARAPSPPPAGAAL